VAKQVPVTNAMRLLKQAGVSFSTSEYEYDESDLSGVHAAAALGVDPKYVYKTLVAKGQSPCVFVIPVAEELDLKKCAHAAGEKRVELLPLKDLTPLTGYVRGGCSPIGMKKKFPTYIDSAAKALDRIYVSAGRRGCQIIINPADLAAFTGAEFSDLTHGGGI